MNTPNEPPCPVILKDLKTWSAILQKIKDDLETARGNQQLIPAAIVNAQFTADFLREQIERCIRESTSLQRLKEDGESLKEQEDQMSARRPDWEKQRVESYLNRTERTNV